MRAGRLIARLDGVAPYHFDDPAPDDATIRAGVAALRGLAVGGRVYR